MRYNTALARFRDNPECYKGSAPQHVHSTFLWQTFLCWRKVMSVTEFAVFSYGSIWIYYFPSHYESRRSVEHCTPHADGAWLNELGWSQ